MRVFAWVGSLVVLLIAAAFIVPPFVDWNRFKTQFEAEASRVLGQRVEVRGATSARLLPTPSITFTDVRVGPADAPHLLAASFGMDLDPAPLLKGDVVIRDMRLDAPRINLRIDENGRLAGNAGDGVVVGGTVAVENITITDGVIRFVDARIEREVILRDIDATASADALNGPWRGDGFVTWQGERVRLGLSTGQWREAGGITLKASVEPQSRPFDLIFDGPLDLSDGLPHLTGLLRINRAPEQTAQDRIDFPRDSAGIGLPVRVEADLDVTPDLLLVPAYEMEIGAAEDPYTITGSGQATLDEVPSFVLRAQGQQVDVARLEATLGVAQDSAQGQTVEQRLEALAEALRDIPRFAAKGVVEVELPAIVAGDTIVRDVKVQIRPVAGQQSWQVSGLEAQLPGRTELRADGVLSLDPSLGFSGDLALASSQPSGFSKWLGAGDDVVISAMRNAGFEAKAEIGNGAFRLDDLEIILDGSRLQGALVREAGQAERDLIDLTLRGKQADFDQLAAWAALFAGTDSGAVTAGHDLRVDLDVARALYDGLSADKVVARVGLLEDVLDIELLEIGDLAGVAVSANGRLVGFDGAALPKSGTMTVALSANEIGDALALLDQRLPDTISLDAPISNAALYGQTDLVFDVKADGGSVEIDGAGEISGTEVDLSVKVSPLSRLDARLVLQADNASAMLAQVGVPVIAGVESGRGALRLALNGPLDGPFRSDATLTMRTGYATAAGDLTFALRHGALRPSGQLAVTADATDLDPFVAISGLPLPGFGEGHGLKSSMQLALAENGFAADAISGTVAGSNVTGRIAVESGLDGKSVLSGSLTVDALSAAIVADSVLSDQQLFDGLSGMVDLSVAELSLPQEGAPPVRDARGQVILEDGDLAIRDASGRWLDGVVEGDISLARSGASNLVSGTVSVSGANIADIEAAFDLPDFATGRLDGSGSFEASAGEGESLLSTLTGSGSARLTSGVLQGVSTKTLQIALQAADATADADLPAQAGAIVRSALAGGLDFGETQVAVAVAGGAARVDNVPLLSGNVSAIGRGRYDLASRTYEARLDATFDPAREAVVGSTPGVSIAVTGGGGAPDVAVDSTEFETFLNMRLTERREREFAARQSAIAQRQRIADTVRLYQLKALAQQLSEEKAAREAEEAARLERERVEAERVRLLEREQEAARDAEAERQAQAERRLQLQRALERDEELRSRAQEALDRLRPPVETEPQLDFRSLGGTD